MDVTLTDVDGISDASERRLREHGFDSVEDLASSNPEDLSEVKNFGPERATKVVSNATDLLTETEMATTDTDDVSTVTISYVIPEEIAMFVIHAIIEESLRLRARGEIPNRNRAYNLFHKITHAYVEEETTHGEDGTWTLELECTMEDLNILKRAISSTSMEYKGTPGIENAYGLLDTLRESIDEDRDQHWGM